MSKKVSLDLRVHPSNPNVTIHHFLVAVRDESDEVIGALKFAQAWSGPWSDRKEQRAWNEISTRLTELSYVTGLEYLIAAHGTEKFCERHLREKGWTLIA